MRKQIVITALSAGLLVGACAGGAERGPDPQILIGAVSRLQCERAVWYRIGLHDGDAGYDQPQRYTFLDNSCSAHGYRPDRGEYLRGVADGERRRGS